MTNEKARDFFSAYYENTLEAGLRVSFEQKLRTDAELSREYSIFVSAMQDLDQLQFEHIEVPSDLHERITARLDRHVFEKERAKKPTWSVWIRGLSFAGIAAVAIMGAVIAINIRGGSGSVGAGAVPSLSKDVITFSASSDGVSVKFQPSSKKSVVVTNEEKILNQTLVPEGGEFKTLLTNSQPNASVFSMQVDSEPGGTYVALPGKSRSAVSAGEGTVVDLAKAVADYFRLPVSVETRSPNERTSWKFSTPDAVSESMKALGKHYRVTQVDPRGVLEIEENDK